MGEMTEEDNGVIMTKIGIRMGGGNAEMARKIIMDILSVSRIVGT